MSTARASSAGLLAQGATASDLQQRLRALGAVALLVSTLLLFWPTMVSLHQRWMDTVQRTYTHGYLVLAIAPWLLWRGRSLWSQVPARPFAAGLVALIGGGLLWLIAYRAGLQVVHQALLPVLAFAALATCYGLAVARRMALPIAYLYFAIPVWSAINPLLQWISVLAVRLLLRLTGVPAYFAENTFTLPAGSFEIAGGCSGLHFFIVALAVAVLYGEINRDSLRTRLKLVALAAMLAMATNWLRIFIIVLAGHFTDMQHYLVSGEHYSFGWVMFAGTMLIFFLVVRRWPLSSSDHAGTAGEAVGDAIPWRGAALALAGLMLAPALQLRDHQRTASEAVPQVLPASVDDWSSTASSVSWQPVFEGADELQQRSFAAPVGSVDSYVAVYVRQHQGKELNGYKNSVLGAELRARGAAHTAGSGVWQELQATDSAGKVWLLWYAYRLDRQWYDSPVALQLAYGFRSLFAAPVAAAVISKSRCADDDCNDAREALRQFTTNAWADGRL